MGKYFSGDFAKLTTESVKVKNVVTRGPRVLKYKVQWTQQVASLRDVGLIYVWRGNPQCDCHRLNSIYFIVFRNTVNHLILGLQLILWGLLTMRLQRFLTGSHSSSVACWDWSHRHTTRPNQPWCDGRKVWFGCNKVRDSAPLLLTHVAPLKTVHGQVFIEWFGLAKGQNEVTR